MPRTHWENHLEILARDFRVALRGLAKDRRFAFIAIFALALGIGASTAIFSVVDNALFEPFPYKDSRHLVTIRLHDQDQADRWRGAFLFAEIQDFMKQNHVFDGMVANLEDDIVYSAGDGNLNALSSGGNDLEETLSELFERFVEKYSVRVESSHRDDDEVWRVYRQPLERHYVISRLSPKKIVSANFDYGRAQPIISVRVTSRG